jgi:hypothetical protein
MIGARAAVAVLLLGAGCNRPGSDEQRVRPRIELRDERGQPRQVLYESGAGRFRWQDVREGSGQVLREGEGRRAQDSSGIVLERVVAASAARELRRPDGTALRLHREGGFLRLGDGAGIPIARARIEKDEALVRDAGGQVLLRARRAGGRIVVTDREGAAVGFVVGEAPSEVAALVWLPSLSAAERALLLTGDSYFRYER